MLFISFSLGIDFWFISKTILNFIFCFFIFSCWWKPIISWIIRFLINTVLLIAFLLPLLFPPSLSNHHEVSQAHLFFHLMQLILISFPSTTSSLLSAQTRIYDSLFQHFLMIIEFWTPDFPRKFKILNLYFVRRTYFQIYSHTII